MAGVLKPLRLGLTGGIGSGKSTVAKMLVNHGAATIDTDAIGRQLSQPAGAAIATLRDAFGAKFIDATGGLDRTRMRELAFSNPAARRRLEAILHPLIGAEAERQANASNSGIVVFEVPLLAESGHWRQRVDAVLVIDCTQATQVLRVSTRPGWSTSVASAVVGQQASRIKRRACADAVIFNDGIALSDLSAQVQGLWVGLLQQDQ